MAGHQQVSTLAESVPFLGTKLLLEPRYEPLERLRRWALALVGASGALAALSLGVGLSQLRLLFLPTDALDSLELARAAQEATGGVLRSLQIAGFVAAAAGFLTWVFHARANVRAFGVRKPRWSRAWSVGAFLVPGVNLVRPYAVMAELWRASDPDVLDPYEWRNAEVPPQLRQWWTALLAWALLSATSSTATWTAGVVLGRLRLASCLSVLSDLAACTAAAFTCALVAQLAALQQAKWERISATGDGPEPPREPLVLDPPRLRMRPADAPETCEPPAVPAPPAAPPTSRFDADTAVRPLGLGRFAATLDRRWWVVASPNGGYLAAILARALESAVGDAERTARSLTIHYTAPASEGPAEIATRVERRGRSLTTLSARMTQGDRLIALALAAYSVPQLSPVTFSHARMPEVPPPDQCPPLPGRIPLHANYEFRWALGDTPFTGAREAACGGWIRLAEGRALDAPLAAAYCDAFPPAVFATLLEPAPTAGIPTIDLTIHFRSPLPTAATQAGEPVLGVFRTRCVSDGFLEEDGELWSRDGQLLVHSRQLALLR